MSKHTRARRAQIVNRPVISLRDYFAAHASFDEILMIRNSVPGNLNDQEARYVHADKMLKARGIR
jgi:hypothetical protein